MIRTFHPLLASVLLLAGTLVSTSQRVPHRTRPAVATSLAFAAYPDDTGRPRYVGRGAGALLQVFPTSALLSGPSGEQGVRLQLLGANPHAALVGEEPLAGKVSYFLGQDPSQWQAKLPTYGAVRARETYPGIDLVYYRGGQNLEYDFIVQPGADPACIAFEIGNQNHRARVTATGELIVPARGSELRMGRPVAYQEVAGVRRPVEAHFVSSGSQLRFALGSFDPRRPLIIDPSISFSTLLGGTAEDYALAVATNPAGRTYVAGRTISLDLATPNAEQPVFGGGLSDAFIALLSADGQTLETITFLGGLGDEVVNNLAIDSAGDLYLTGSTNSGNFPLRNPIQGRFQGGLSDAFVVKLNSDVDDLLYATYLGGGGQDVGEGIAIGPGRTAYITGKTGSINFPVTAGSFQRRLGGGTTDAFVARLADDGASLRFSTYLGDRGEENFGPATGRIAVDTAGNAYVTGTTTSPRFPTSLRAFQRILRGGQDVFLTKLDDQGEELLYSTLLGGGSRDFAGDVAVTPEGSAVVTGITESVNFPVTSRAFQRRFGGGFWDAFVTRFNPAGEQVVFSSYLGGRGDEGATFGVVTDFGAVDLRPGGEIVVAGRTDSLNFPLVDPVQLFRGGFTDGFFSRFSNDGERLLESTYLGGGANDVAADLSVDRAGDVTLAGFTASRDFPLIHAVQPFYAGGFSDAWVLRINEPVPPALRPQLRLSDDQLDFGSRRVGRTRTLTLTLRNAGRTALDVSVGSLTAPFEVIEGGGDFTLARGKSRKVRIRFSPTAVGRSRQDLLIESTDPNLPTTTVAVVGRGT